MKNLIDLEKKINSELTTKINRTEIKHNQIYLETDKDDLIDVVLFLKTNNETKFRQLIDITVTDYPREKYGDDREEADWELVRLNRVCVCLNNGHWAYGEQISPMGTNPTSWHR